MKKKPKITLKSISLFMCVLILAFSSCKEDDPDITEDGAFLYANYQNDGNNPPKLIIDTVNSTEEIVIENNPSVNEVNGRILFNYPGVTIKKEKKVYQIDNIITQWMNNDKWIEDDENTLEWTFSKSLDIVLVLDVSSSLGGNIQSVKNNATKMANDVLAKNPDARISVVKFSRGSTVLGFTSNRNTIGSFIQGATSYTSPDIGTYNLEGRNETGLYEAIDTAINLLLSSPADGKGVLTFTDGVSNFQFDASNQSPDKIIQKLKNSEISSYTIGFEGNQGSVERSALEKIAVNGDFSFPKSIQELDEVFVRFSNSVAAVYDLVYDTNNAVFTGQREYRFRFETTLISE